MSRLKPGPISGARTTTRMTSNNSKNNTTPMARATELILEAGTTMKTAARSSWSGQFALDGDHLDGGDGGLEAFVSGFEAGAVEGLLEGLAGEDAEGVGGAGLLLGLADAAGDLVVDGLVVGGLAAEEAAEGDDGVELLCFGFFHLCEGAGGGGDLPGSGDADDLDVGFGCAAAVEGVEGALQEAVGDDGVPAGGDDGEGHAGGGEVALDGDGFVVE